MARLDKVLRARVQDQIPPRKCSGMVKKTGKPCKKPALVGATVCWTHGAAAPQVRAKAIERVTLAERLQTSPVRQPWDILADVQHGADVLFQDARAKLEQGSLSVEDFDQFVSAMERAARLTTSNVHAGLAERRQRFAEGQAQIMHRFVMAVLEGVGLTAEQRARVPAVIKGVVEGELVRGEIAA
jgi:hypothetical protein